MFVKICGNKRLQDALKAVEYGADAIGVLVGRTHISKDFIPENLAAEIIAGLPPSCVPFMVTHMTDPGWIAESARKIKARAIQLHGDSSPEDLRRIRKELPGMKLVKTVHVENENSIEKAREYFKSVDALLLDTARPSAGEIGGTGVTHDWSISQRIVEESPVPVILAGGLNPENVEEAILIVRPFGVDVNSGVKGANGFKDYGKIKKFIENAKR